MDGISALMKEAPQRSLPLAPCEDRARRPSVNRSVPSPEAESASTWISDSQPPELQEMNFSCS